MHIVNNDKRTRELYSNAMCLQDGSVRIMCPQKHAFLFDNKLYFHIHNYFGYISLFKCDM